MSALEVDVAPDSLDGDMTKHPLDSDDAGSEGGEVNELDVSYEQERMENIKKNAALMASLGLSARPSVRPRGATLLPRGKKPKVPISSAEERTRRQTRAREAALKRDLEPTRRSSRVAERSAAPDYTSNGVRPASPSTGLGATSEGVTDSLPRSFPIPKRIAPTIPSGPQYDAAAGPSTPAPRPGRDPSGTLIFEGRWQGIFTPNVTPEEMFLGGAFAGAFFADTYSQRLKSPLRADVEIANLPFSPPSRPSDVNRLLTNPEPDGDLNRFRVRAGQSLQEWEKAGWIWDGDPRGWAQWYMRFWNGRRCVDDERQVRRWLKVAGPTGRFKRALMKKVYSAGGIEGGGLADEDVGRVLRQCLWQWGYELTPSEYTEAMSGEA